MSNLENALRGALAKGDTSDPIFRRRVYEAAANAIERSLKAKGAATAENIQAQNLQLVDTIKKIEAEIKLAKAAAPTIDPSQSAQPEAVEQVTAPEPVQEAVDEVVVSEPVQEPVTAEPTVSLDDVKPEARDLPPSVEPESRAHIVAEPRQQVQKEATTSVVNEPKRKAPFATFLTGAIAVALLGIGLFWVITTGAFQSAEERDTSVPNPSRVLESESFEGRDPGTSNAPATLNAQTADADGWTTIFTPEDPTTLGLVDGAVAEVTSDSFGDYARIITPNEVAQVEIDVPLSVLRFAENEQLQISLIARSDEGQPTQMSVTCDFGASGDCGRHRFNVGQAESEFLIQVDVANAQSATSSGRIILITDMEGQGRAVKLLKARIRAL